MENHFFTSDLHFNHQAIISYTGRPWTNILDMNHGLLVNWNSVVGKRDYVYIVGDFAFANKVEVEKFLKQLNGHKILVIGNHDDHRVTSAKGWSWTGHYKELKVLGQKIVLSHYPFRAWNGCGRGTWMLHGHEHARMKPHQSGLSFDVGVDSHPEYRPFHFDEVKKIITDASKNVDYNRDYINVFI